MECGEAVVHDRCTQPRRASWAMAAACSASELSNRSEMKSVGGGRGALEPRLRRFYLLPLRAMSEHGHGLGDAGDCPLLQSISYRVTGICRPGQPAASIGRRVGDVGTRLCRAAAGCCWPARGV